MHRTRPTSTLLTTLSLAAAATLAACDGAADDDGASDKVLEPAVVRSALNDAFATGEFPQIATAGGADRYMNVWMIQTATTMAVAGQVFDTNGVPLGPSRIYGETTHMKLVPDVSYDPFNKRFLIVWEDQYSQTDRDILGIITDQVGAQLFAPTIDFSTTVENQPSVTFVAGGINKWLVTYERHTNGVANDRRIRGRYVDPAGALGAVVDMTVPSSMSYFQPQARWIPSTNKIALSWSNGTTVALAFAPAASLLTAAATSIPLVGASNYWPHRTAVNPNNNVLAVAFYDTDHATNARKVRLKLLPPGCESFTCASIEQPTTFATSASVTTLGDPIVAPLGLSFVIYAYQDSTALPNGTSIKFAQVNQVGVVGTKREATIPACPTARTNRPGATGFSVTSLSGAARTNLIYDAYCPGQGRVLGQQMSTGFVVKDYQVSDAAK